MFQSIAVFLAVCVVVLVILIAILLLRKNNGRLIISLILEFPYFKLKFECDKSNNDHTNINNLRENTSYFKS